MLRPLVSSSALLLVVGAVVACGAGSNVGRSESNATSYDFPACVEGSGALSNLGAATVTDETGTASVTTTGAACARTFVLSSTASREDNIPAGPVTLAEKSGASSIATNNPLFDALYQLALDDAAQSSVSAIQDGSFNNGANLQCPDGGCFQTGRKWTYVWTRDTSYATNLGLGWIDPVRATNSLGFKLSPRRDGTGLEIVQDTGTGGSYPISTDRVVWSLGAGEILNHLSGAARTTFRDKAFEAAKNTIEHDRVVVFDPTDGLYRGEQSFLDWREQTYPAWTVPDTVQIGRSKALSTNLAHLAILDFAARLATETGDAATARTMTGRAADLRKAIAAKFWIESEHALSTFLTTELDPSPARHYDLLGTSLAVLLDAVPADKAAAALASYPTLPKGPPVIFPEQRDTPIYHNRAIWPFVTAYWAKAARKVGNDAAFDRAIASLVRGAALNLSNMENLEVTTGRPFVDDGWMSGPVVNSQRQLWSVAGYVGTVVDGLFGVEATSDGVKVAPFVTHGLHTSLFPGATQITLNNLALRGKSITVVVNLPGDAPAGAYGITGIRFNGGASDGNVKDSDLGARNLFEVTLGAPTTAPGSVRTIADLSDDRVLYAPHTPSVSVGLVGGGLQITANLAGEDPGALTWSVYRDGTLVADALPGSDTAWTDTDAGASSPTHCYAVETRYAATGNASQHAQPSCFWGASSERVQSIDATAFTTNGGALTSDYGRSFYQFWGDPGSDLTTTFTADHTGTHLVQATYGNGAGPINTGITCAVKHVVVEDAVSGASVGDGYMLMPQRGDWSSWGDSSFVHADLVAGRSYKVHLSHDDRSVNMSAYQHFTAYTGGTGGASGEFFRVNVAALKILSLAP